MVCASAGVIALPDDLDSLDASALIIAQVGYNAASRLPENADGPVLVVGDGVIGQFCAQALLARGFSVILTGHHESRLQLAKGASPELQVINASNASLAELIRRTHDTGLNMVVDTVGSPNTIQEGMQIIPRFGHLVIAGWWGGKGMQQVDVHRVFAKEPTLYFPAGVERSRMLATIELMRTSKIKVKPLVTHTFGGEDFPRACRLLGGSNREYLGIAIRWA